MFWRPDNRTQPLLALLLAALLLFSQATGVVHGADLKAHLDAPTCDLCHLGQRDLIESVPIAEAVSASLRCVALAVQPAAPAQYADRSEAHPIRAPPRLLSV